MFCFLSVENFFKAKKSVYVKHVILAQTTVYYI